MSYENDNELITTEQSTVIAVAPKSADSLAVRIAREVETAMISARRFPRDEFVCADRIKRAMSRPRLAEKAEYEFPRGGSKVSGASVHALRAVKAAWGNIQSGWMEIERKLGQSTVIAYAMDLETNARAEITFQVRHMRDTKQGPKPLTDERDIYEMVANVAARRERKCLQDIIPADIVDDAVDAARATLRGQSKEPIQDRIKKMVGAFSEFGVTIAAIERRLGHKLDAISENKLAELRRVYTSLHDGVGKPEDFFDLAEPKTADPEDAGKTKAERTAESLKGSKKKDEPKQPSPEDADRSAKIRVNIARALDRALDEPPLQREAAIKKVMDDIQDPDNPVVDDDDRTWALDYVVEKKKGLKS
jgi:hypothetical protein